MFEICLRGQDASDRTLAATQSLGVSVSVSTARTDHFVSNYPRML
jgi:hypothetical protein